MSDESVADSHESRQRSKGHRVDEVAGAAGQSPTASSEAPGETISGRKKAEQVLPDGEEFFRLLVEGVKDYAIIRLDREGRVLSWNRAAERIKGYHPEEILGKHFSVFYPAEEIERRTPEQCLEQALVKGQFEGEGWRVRKNGSRFWASVLITPLHDAAGNLCGYAKVTRDITERKQAEEALRKTKEDLELRVKERTAELARINQELQAGILERVRGEEQLRRSMVNMRALAARLQGAREEERTHVAREIHDVLGQACTALKMDLFWLVQRLPKGEKQLRERADSMLKLIDETIHSVRRISSQLRPSTLDDLGLTAALEWQAQEFEARAGIKCRLSLPAEDITLDTERATAIFRIFQETLTNVARHADATRVDVRLVKDGEMLILDVSDNGKGLDEAQASIGKSLGLLGMKERAVLVGGQFQIMSSPGKGTTVTVRIPAAERRKGGQPSRPGL